MSQTSNDLRGYVGKIPVRNLWLLMLYASETRFLIPQLSSDEISVDNPANLIAEVLCDLVKHRLKKNLSSAFVTSEREVNRVRGRIHLLKSERRMSLAKGKIVCSFDELTLDSERNRYIRSALDRLVLMADNKQLSMKCHYLSRRFQDMGVNGVVSHGYRPSRQGFARHESDDREVLEVAELAHDMHLLSESLGTQFLPSPDKQRNWVYRIFEKAVGGFYKLRLSENGWNVRTGTKLDWNISAGTTPGIELMPAMKLDILLENKSLQRRIIIDTKFTNILNKNQFGSQKFKSLNIYQLYSYLLSQEKKEDNLSLSSSGMLLYPSIGESYDEFVTMQGHDIRFCTVDLSEKSELIIERLLQLVPNSTKQIPPPNHP
ncbi:5-methylcytosine-specific restriction enzyme subunit McrC [Vibrio aerogenes CECT 7868]|uniref:5-methylcytosine-specific restriction enzyme subunit McrC n=1 Tax=Vibrio aerogenes CECT 7868 TaxID=1216006 RepID=A0A1M5ZS31_9VIBR|nr:hypothetical protein [Vibrio aerogenes]SHI27070.1 5-methylcytosine-specific restriction enzyme subunit McrC [Vibrio aerogenes CECT 7868]